MGKWDFVPRLFLTVYPWSFIPSLSKLTTIWNCPLELREGRRSWMKAVSYNQINVVHRRTVPRSPTGPWTVWLLVILPSILARGSGGSDGKESACNAGDLSSIPVSGQSHGEGNVNPLQYSCLENPMDPDTWPVTVQGVAKSKTWLSNQPTRTKNKISTIA